MFYEDKITKADISTLTTYILDYGNGSSTAVPAILDAWCANKDKGNLFRLFGEDLILSREVELEASKHQKVEEIAMVRDKYWHHISTLQTFFNEHPERDHITKSSHHYFIGADKEADVWAEIYLLDVLTCDAFAENSLDRELRVFPHDFSLMQTYNPSSYYNFPEVEYPDSKKNECLKVIPKGTKMSRFINHTIIPIVEKIDPTYANEIKTWTNQFFTEISRINQSTKFRGTLCLSIHPMDYITMSDTPYGWTSCMSWGDDGEYKRGTMEMLSSPMCVVAYLKGSEDLEGYWNGKIWRELFMVTPEIILGIKGYPYHNEIVEDYIMDWLRELAETNCGWKYLNDTVVRTKKGYSINTEYGYVKWELTYNAMYNDCYLEHPIYFAQNYDVETRQGLIDLEPSGPAICIITGEDISDIECSEQFLAHPRHLGYVKCERCGYWIDEYDIYHTDNDLALCEGCYYDYQDEHAEDEDED